MIQGVRFRHMWRNASPASPGLILYVASPLPRLAPTTPRKIGVLTAAQITCPDCQRKLCEDTTPGASWTNPFKIFIKHFSRCTAGMRETARGPRYERRGWFFQKKDTKNVPDFICDPWWWPRGPGRQKADWGIPCCDRFVLQSLQSPRDHKIRITSF